MPSQQSVFEQMREEAESADMTEESKQLLLKCIDDAHVAFKSVTGDVDFCAEIPFDVALIYNAAIVVMEKLKTAAETRRSAASIATLWLTTWLRQHQDD